MAAAVSPDRLVPFPNARANAAGAIAFERFCLFPLQRRLLLEDRRTRGHRQPREGDRSDGTAANRQIANRLCRSALLSDLDQEP